MVGESSYLEILIWVALFLTGLLSIAGENGSVLFGRIFRGLLIVQLVVICTSALVTCLINGSCPSI